MVALGDSDSHAYQGRITFPDGGAERGGLAHLCLADGHAGTVLNAHWAQAFAATIKDEFGAPFTPISDVERDAFLIELSNADP